MTERAENLPRTWPCALRGAILLSAVLSVGLTVPARQARPATTAPAAVAPAEAQPAAWQHHHVTFSYFGITTLYNCSGLESKVQAILEFLGARRGDLKVYASGCMGGPDVPTHSAWVDADFYSPAPAPAGDADVVTARWTPFELNDRHPNFMGGGDCELMQSMKDTVQKNLASRELAYNTDCFPHEVHPGDFKVTGEALKVPASATK